jgi:hypothetical protein
MWSQPEDRGQVEPALAGCDVGGQPDLIWPVGHKILIQQVWRHRQGMLAVGRAHAIAARRSSPYAMLAHHPLDPLAANDLRGRLTVNCGQSAAPIPA